MSEKITRLDDRRYAGVLKSRIEGALAILESCLDDLPHDPATAERGVLLAVVNLREVLRGRVVLTDDRLMEQIADLKGQRDRAIKGWGEALDLHAGAEASAESGEPERERLAAAAAPLVEKYEQRR
jgi:hypothetical protein